jgi:Ca-activated chloride channel family protein
MLNSGVLPQGDAVRAEELINYFDYDYPLPESKEQPFRATVAVSDAPWAQGRKLMHIGIKGYDIAPAAQPRSNLVFLLDVSGSMNSPDKLPLVIQSMELLLSTLNPDDTVAIAVYAGAAGKVLEPTPVKEKQKILDALHRLSAGGSTAGAQGIRLAYELAESRFDREAVNRVILATDGDFNVGITNQRELQSFIERKRDAGIFLSVLGFGQGNYQDALMQTLAQNGNGVAAYIDTLSEAQKVLVDEATSTLFPIAKDVKIQVEFNPATVAEYRLIGYETRHLNREDFNNDAVDAGDIGAGHTVTAIYEFTPMGSSARQIKDTRYAPDAKEATGKDDEYAFVKIRYKLPEEDTSRLITQPVTHADAVELGTGGIGREAGFATAVAGFAQLLKGGKYTGDYDYDDVIALAQRTRGDDPFGYRTEFVQLVRKAKTAAAMARR